VLAVNSAQYSGTVAWEDEEGTALDGNFEVSTVYTAVITLAPKPPYTFAGVQADFFTVAGVAATNAEDTGIVTVTFPATGAVALTSFDITVTGATGATSSISYEDDFVTINADVSPVVDGYQVTGSQGNNWALAGFAVNLGDKTLADFKAITLTFEAVSGSDYGYKKIHMLAATATDKLPTAGGFTAANYQVTRDSTASDPDRYSNQTEDQGVTDPKDMTIYLNPPEEDAGDVWSESELEIAFWLNMGISTFKITNIVFVPND
jgi:hypothetical protein